MLYQLITTGLTEELDNNEEKIFLLSSWCNTLEMEAFLKEKNKLIFPYHWKDKNKFNLDYKYLSVIYERNLEIISESLSKKHSIGNITYWRLIIGSWLRQFSDIVYDRYSQIKLANKNYKLFTKLVAHEKDKLADLNYNEFYFKSKTDSWNHILIGNIWKELKLTYKISQNKFNNNEIFYSGKKVKIKELINLINFKLVKNNRIFIHNTNFNYKNFLNLSIQTDNFALKSYPIKQKIFTNKYDEEFRKSISNILLKSNEYEEILSKLISLYLPKIYLEDFYKNRIFINKIFPKNPELIITTHSYALDDLFKIWVAEKKISNDSKYIINQHGGCIRLCKLDQEEEHMIATSDEFISWGWTKEGEAICNNLPSIQLSNLNIKSKKNGNILIVLASYPRYYYSSYSVPISEDYLIYLSNIEKIYNSINLNKNKKIIFRFDKEYTAGWEAEKRLRKKIPLLKKDHNIKIRDSLNNSRFVISTSNSTVFLETLSANYPTVLFLDLNLYQLREDVLEDFINLNKIKICHFEIETLSSHVNIINNELEQWWYQEKLQDIIKIFCKKYAKRSKKPVSEWACQLKSKISKI